MGRTEGVLKYIESDGKYKEWVLRYAPISLLVARTLLKPHKYKHPPLSLSLSFFESHNFKL